MMPILSALDKKDFKIFKELIELQKSFHILSADVESGKSFNKENFKQATIATIVACRLKSSRLEKKHCLR